ncbi:hypothetical protein D1T48_gp03 [Thermoproteus tenax virus 1]|uniref:Uncharacterized 6.9 kDa protein n=1 Tax=Thermoproteus tenax virus 1 (strain KRA1) TaxID=10480 RepID=YOR3_TTV1K|nr:hypothetical protein D1T48_gp03 [Thermoproteus tenax virus 1]P19278.1 RecName: Full=Uncharacterized 6.9 kDa protein [Thermoproteus tenax virus 1 (STRAIN KRA1)]CAA32971.1 unnamed protein product [Thermoproteus tenax virus 1]
MHIIGPVSFSRTVFLDFYNYLLQSGLYETLRIDRKYIEYTLKNKYATLRLYGKYVHT